MTSKCIQFLKPEVASGIALVLATVLALLISNSPLLPFYEDMLAVPILVQIGEVGLNKPFLLWINDGLMAVFFCSIAIEIKRKLIDGTKQATAQISLPLFGAAGGIVIPALIFLVVNLHYPENYRGWAIPTATDIAFPLGILAILGNRVHYSLKLFLVMLAVTDDLAAILVIALFYTSKLSFLSLSLAFIGVALLVVLNRTKVHYTMAYVLVGVFLWICMVKSGVHATLTGVALGFALPYYKTKKTPLCPLLQIEHDLRYFVPYVVLPLFAFANAGVPLTGVSFAKLLDPLPLGIALGLCVGKPLGVLSFVWLALQLRLTSFYEGMEWKSFIGVAFLAGIGFTMSLFLGTLAFDESLLVKIRMGVLTGTFIAALIGTACLYLQSHNPKRKS